MKLIRTIISLYVTNKPLLTAVGVLIRVSLDITNKRSEGGIYITSSEWSRATKVARIAYDEAADKAHIIPKKTA